MLFLAQVRGGTSPGPQVLDDLLVDGIRGPLVAVVVVVALLELRGGGTRAEKGEDVMDQLQGALAGARREGHNWLTYVVVEASLVEEDVVCLGLC